MTDFIVAKNVGYVFSNAYQGKRLIEVPIR